MFNQGTNKSSIIIIISSMFYEHEHEHEDSESTKNTASLTLFTLL